jgi:hypothetical protein
MVEINKYINKLEIDTIVLITIDFCSEIILIHVFI